MNVYILKSLVTNKYYVGQTQDLSNRIDRHNKGLEKYTKTGVPWELIWSTNCSDRSEAMKLEQKIKKRGARRFLEDNKFGV